MARSRPPAKRDSRRLFAPGELALKPSAVARLRALAAIEPRTATERERRNEEDERTIRQLKRQGADLARRYGLRYLAIEPEAAGVVEHYGICYEDGLIRIRLRHARTGKLLKDSSLVDTLCHELAHLKHFDHSARFRRFYQRILDTARELGYYRPGPQERPGPVQLGLFGDGCGTRRQRA